jgi:hypothetical protein
MPKDGTNVDLVSGLSLKPLEKEFLFALKLLEIELSG